MDDENSKANSLFALYSIFAIWRTICVNSEIEDAKCTKSTYRCVARLLGGPQDGEPQEEDETSLLNGPYIYKYVNILCVCSFF
jgi:hypothetical protein